MVPVTANGDVLATRGGPFRRTASGCRPRCGRGIDCRDAPARSVGDDRHGRLRGDRPLRRRDDAVLHDEAERAGGRLQDVLLGARRPGTPRRAPARSRRTPASQSPGCRPAPSQTGCRRALRRRGSPRSACRPRPSRRPERTPAATSAACGSASAPSGETCRLSIEKPLTSKVIEPLTVRSIIASGLRREPPRRRESDGAVAQHPNVVVPGKAPALVRSPSRASRRSRLRSPRSTSTSVSVASASRRSRASDAVAGRPAASSSAESTATPGTARASAARPSASIPR